MPVLKKTKPHASLAPDLASNPEVLEVNLVRDEVAVEFNWGRRLGSLFLILLLVAALVAEIYFGLDWWQGQERTQAEKLKADHLLTTQQINNINNNSKDFLDFKDKTSLVEQLIDQHIYWSDFFTWLEQNTLSSVRYFDFSGDVSGEYTLAAQTKNYRDISWQTKAFKDNPWVDEVSVQSGVLQEEDIDDSNLKEEWINFSVVLKIKPQIFYRLKSETENVETEILNQDNLEINSGLTTSTTELDSGDIEEALPFADLNILESNFPPLISDGEPEFELDNQLEAGIVDGNESELEPELGSEVELGQAEQGATSGDISELGAVIIFE